jgi:tRNA pseudouridine13 synthase
MLPLATADLPGTGGSVPSGGRECEEVLAKQAAATGEHIWLRVAKEGLSTQQARAAVARAGAVAVERIGFAGNRDRVGRCVQWFSVPQALVENPGALKRAGTQGKMRVLEVTASHKPVDEQSVARLRWRLRVRGGAVGEGYQRGRAVLDRLRRGGLPNYVPFERFGKDGGYAKWGRLLAQGKRLPERVLDAGADAGRCLRAWQEQLFDRWLAHRVEEGLLGTCLEGEVVANRQGELATVAFREHVQKRMDSWEVSPLGPLFGAGMSSATGEAEARERAVLAEAGMDEASVSRLRGGRRAARAQPTSVLLDLDGADLLLTCELPTETYVSVLLDELIKPAAESAAPAEADEP